MSNRFRFVFWSAAMLLFMLVFILPFMSCNVAKKVEIKDAAAVGRVSAKKSLLDQLRGQMDSLYPNNCDTTKLPGAPVYLPGKIEKVPVYFPLNVYRNRSIDTTIHDHRIILDSLGNLSFEFNEKAADTVQLPGIRITDNKKLDIARNAELAAKLALAKLQGAHDQMIIQHKEDGKRSNNLYWLIGGMIALLVLTNGLWIYSKFKKPIKII